MSGPKAITQTYVPQHIGLSLVEAAAVELVDVGRALHEKPDTTGHAVLHSDPGFAGEPGEPAQGGNAPAVDGDGPGAGEQVRREAAGHGIADLEVAAVEVMRDPLSGEGSAPCITLVPGVVEHAAYCDESIHLDAGTPAEAPAGVERRGPTAVEVGQR